MASEFTELFSRLCEPFGPDDVKERAAQGGRRLKYITARSVMNRLDEVLGPESWWDDYIPLEHSVVCKLSIRLPNGETLTKCDAGGHAGMADLGDDDKSGFSDALKRAAAKFGVGRHLYGDGVPDFAADHQAQRHTSRPEPAQAAQRQHPEASRSSPNPNDFKVPPTGKAVFAWAKRMEEHFRTSIINGMKNKAKELGYATLMNEWSADQVQAVCVDAIEYLKTTEGYKGEFSQQAPAAQPEAHAIRPADPGRPKIAGSPIAEARQQLLGSVTSLCRACGDAEPSAEKLKAVVFAFSANAANAHGHKGEVMLSLKDCDDKDWIDNTIVLVCDRLNDVHRIKKEGGTVTSPTEPDDDIPF